MIERTAAGLCRALSGSVDLLEQAISAEDGSGTTVQQATNTLVNQMRLRETAWGPADDPLSLRQIKALAEGLPNHVAVNLSALPAATVFPASLGQIVLNILILAADSLPQGGQVVLAGAPDDLLVQIVGPAAAWPIGLALCLINEAEANAALTDGRNLQMALTATLAHAKGIRLSALIPPAAQPEPAILRLGG